MEVVLCGAVTIEPMSSVTVVLPGTTSYVVRRKDRGHEPSIDVAFSRTFIGIDGDVDGLEGDVDVGPVTVKPTSSASVADGLRSGDGRVEKCNDCKND